MRTDTREQLMDEVIAALGRLPYEEFVCVVGNCMMAKSPQSVQAVIHSLTQLQSTLVFLLEEDTDKREIIGLWRDTADIVEGGLPSTVKN